MIHGFVKVCAATPDIKVADCEYNATQILELIKKCEKEKVKLVVFPELCITGYTCSDLFLQDTLLRSAKEQLIKIVRATAGMEILAIVGLPYVRYGKLYNVAAALNKGEVVAK